MYAYAFLRIPHDRVELPMGIEAASALIRCDRLSALVEPGLRLDDLQQSDERLMRAVVDHDRIIQDLFQYVTVLPLRFGTSFLSEQHLINHLREKQQQYLSKLEALEGKAEYLIKFQPKPYEEEQQQPEGRQTGRSYFVAKKHRYQAQTQYQQQQQQEFQTYMALLQEHGLEITQGERSDGTERVYLLGDRTQASVLEELVNHNRDSRHSWTVHIGEALPPYHFVGR